MRKRDLKRVLDTIRQDMIIDSEEGSNTAVCVFYTLINGVKHFNDYEIAETDSEKYSKYLTSKELIKYQQAINGLKNNEKLEVVNIVYDDENIELMSLKEALWLVAQLEYPEVKTDLLCLYIQLWLNNISFYKLSTMLGVSRQLVSQWKNGIRPISSNQKEAIAKLLKFDVEEFDHSKTEFVFEDMDL